MSNNFTHLHLHSEYSLLDGFCPIKKLVKTVKELGMDSVAITDHGDMFGVVDFYKACKKEGIKPVIGCEVYMSERGMEDKDPRLDKNNYHLILLAENNEGYKNLIKIVSEAYVRGFYYKPRVDIETLKKYNKGLIVMSACIGGMIPQRILEGRIDEARKLVEEFIEIYGKDNFFLEIQDHQMMEEKQVNEVLIKFAKEYSLGLVATNDAHYIKKEDAETHDILICVQTASNVNDENRMRFFNDTFYLKSEEEMNKLFSYVPEALENTKKITDRCNVEFEFNNYHLPKYQLPEETTSKEYLKKLCIEGLNRKYDKEKDDFVALGERLKEELGVINDMGFNDYFLIVWDFIKYARDNDIPVGPGRGSAAGSLVSYCLDITQVDPIKYSLIFERFLNSERVSMPDIDIDFCYENRYRVIEYVVEKYGFDNVSQIATFGTMAARAAIKDVARSMGLSYALADKVSKQIPQELKMTLEKALDKNPELKKMAEEDESVKKLIEVSMAIEGMPRHVSTHAAGVVISDKPLSEYVPLYLNKGSVATQFPMTTVEELGLLKMDFLGLRNLTVIKDTINNVKASKNIHIDIDKLEFDDHKVFETISRGDTLGVFQLESSGMQNFMRSLRPDNFEDIIAGISLYRPGPMDEIPTYIENKHNPLNITYMHSSLEPILNVTYGCMVYQEQVMQIVRDLAGYSMGRSDILRRAMGKKKMEVMDAERKVFLYGDEEGGVPGCLSIGISEDIANKIYDKMIEFAKYAFNKSHAAAYAVVAYQTAYLKTYYPVEFMAALLTSVMGFEAKLKQYINYLREKNIAILPPDVNISNRNFTVDKESIRFGLLAVKNLGETAIDEIIKAREEKGVFTSFYDFVEKIEFDSLNKRGVESLIKCGAFDSLNHKRSELMSVFSEHIDSTLKSRRQNISGQINLFDMLGEEERESVLIPETLNIEEFPSQLKLEYEKEALGMYISGHPLNEYTKIIKEFVSSDIISIKEEFELEEGDEKPKGEFKDSDTVVLSGLITSRKVIYTKKNELMCFATIEDLTDNIEVVAFPKVYQSNLSLLEEDKKVLLKGTISVKEEGQVTILARELWDLEDKLSINSINKANIKKPYPKNAPYGNRKNNEVQGNKAPVQIIQEDKKENYIPKNKDNKIRGEVLTLTLDKYTISKLSEIREILLDHPGECKVILHNIDENKKYVANKKLWVTLNEEIINQLSNIIGRENLFIE